MGKGGREKRVKRERWGVSRREKGGGKEVGRRERDGE